MNFTIDTINDLDIQILCLFLMSIIAVTYFSKRKVGNYENFLFVILLLSNFIGAILDITSIISIYYYDIFPIITNVFCKAYLSSILFYEEIITVYLLYTSFDLKKKNNFAYNKNIKKKLWFVISIVFIINLIIIILSPIKYNMVPGKVYSYGKAVDFTFNVSSIFIVVWVLFMIIRWKKFSKIKLLPIITYVIGGVICAIFQRIYPDILMITFLITIALFIMHFTIENPDLDLIEELTFTKNQADNANQAKSEFLSSMSHEIRTPLNAIVGYSQILIDIDCDNESKKYIEEIRNSSRLLLDIINCILDYSKIDAGKFELFESDYSPKKVVDDYLLDVSKIYNNKNIIFSSHIGNLPNALYGDKKQIQQLMHHLVSNAFKFTANGKIDFKVECEKEKDYYWFIITVEDTGLGIKEEDIPKLCIEFEKLDTTKKIKIEGAGLGLTITKRLVDMMDGKIMVQSIYGKGSKFTVKVKQKESNVIFKQEIEDNNIEDFTGKRFLIVDDNNVNLKVAERLFKSVNSDVVCLTSGKDCLEEIKNNKKYDLIFLDDMMPEMDGTTVLNELKEIEGFNTKVIILTAKEESGLKEKYLAKGFDDYLAKPIKKEELIKVLNTNLK